MFMIVLVISSLSLLIFLFVTIIRIILHYSCIIQAQFLQSVGFHDFFFFPQQARYIQDSQRAQGHSGQGFGVLNPWTFQMLSAQSLTVPSKGGRSPLKLEGMPLDAWDLLIKFRKMQSSSLFVGLIFYSHALNIVSADDLGEFSGIL